MPTTQYLPFAEAAGANTLTPATYAADAQRAVGNQPGTARSEFVNTSLRQACTGVAGLAQFAITKGALDVPDDGNPTTVANALVSAIAAMIAEQQFWSAGDLKATVSSTTPAGWLYANGAFFSASAYPNLAAVAVARGWASTGSGPTLQYRLPDLRGRFLRGLDDGRGLDGQPSRTLGSEQNDELRSHTHTVNGWWNEDLDTVAIAGGGGYVTSAANTSATGGVETRPYNTAVRYLIKT